MHSLTPRFGAIHIGTKEQFEELLRRLQLTDSEDRLAPGEGPVAYLREITGDQAINPVEDQYSYEEVRELKDDKKKAAEKLPYTFDLCPLDRDRFMVVTNSPDPGFPELPQADLSECVRRKEITEAQLRSEGEIDPGPVLSLSEDFKIKRTAFRNQLALAELIGRPIHYMA